MTFKVVEVRDLRGGLKGLQHKVANAASQIVEVGIFDNPELTKRALRNEYGTHTVPPRPFMRAGLDSAQQELDSLLRQAAIKILDGMHPRVALARVGIRAEAIVRQSLVDWTSPPNAASTIRRKGFDDPLVEHGDMRRAIKHRVAPISGSLLLAAAQDD